MGYPHRTYSPSLIRAMGMHYLMRFLAGESILHISKETGHHSTTITKYMKTAAATLIDAAQQTLLSDVLPLMTKVIKAALQQQLDAAEKGKAIDTAMVERMLKGLYVLDAPQLKTALVRQAEDETGGPDTKVETLEGFVAKRFLVSPKPEPPASLPASIIDAEKVEDDKD